MHRIVLLGMPHVVVNAQCRIRDNVIRRRVDSRSCAVRFGRYINCALDHREELLALQEPLFG